MARTQCFSLLAMAFLLLQDFTSCADGSGMEQYSHPMVALFTVVFKFSAIAFYIIYPWIFSANFTILFAVTVLLLALDFWTMKNVSGRLLVGLRWWNEINADGESMWHYESLDQQGMPVLNQKDSWLFWWSLYITPAVWLALGLLTLIRLQFIHLLVVGVALVFNTANIIGFTKCRKDATKQIQAFATQTVGSRMANSLQEYLV